LEYFFDLLIAKVATKKGSKKSHGYSLSRIPTKLVVGVPTCEDELVSGGTSGWCNSVKGSIILWQKSH
jgi:hypothetical protein